MKISSDDPRLTAYAFGEDATPADRAAVEAALQAQPELRAALDEIRAGAILFKKAFQTETKDALSLPQRQKVLGLAPNKRSTRTFWLTMTSLAAGLASVVIFTKTQHHKMREEALAPPAVTHTEIAVEEYLAQKEQEAPPAAAQAKRENKAKLRAEGGMTFGGVGAARSAAPMAKKSASPETALVASESATESHVWVAKLTLQPQSPAAKEVLNWIDTDLRACLKKEDPDALKEGRVVFAVKPESQQLQAREDTIERPSLTACWLGILTKKTWPGPAPYDLTIEIH